MNTQKPLKLNSFQRDILDLVGVFRHEIFQLNKLDFPPRDDVGFEHHGRKRTYENCAHSLHHILLKHLTDDQKVEANEYLSHLIERYEGQED